MSITRSLMLALAIVAFHFSPTAFAQDMQYVGTTTPTFDGRQGIFAAHQACRVQFGGVWCTSEMIVENGPHPFALGPPETGAWINPAPTGFTNLFDPAVGGGPLPRALDFSGFVRQPEGLNCDSWSDNFLGLSGIILVTEVDLAGAVVRMTLGFCEVFRPAACCGGHPFQKIPLVGPFAPPDREDPRAP